MMVFNINSKVKICNDFASGKLNDLESKLEEIDIPFASVDYKLIQHCWNDLLIIEKDVVNYFNIVDKVSVKNYSSDKDFFDASELIRSLSSLVRKKKKSFYYLVEDKILTAKNIVDEYDFSYSNVNLFIENQRIVDEAYNIANIIDYAAGKKMADSLSKDFSFIISGVKTNSFVDEEKFLSLMFKKYYGAFQTSFSLDFEKFSSSFDDLSTSYSNLEKKGFLNKDFEEKFSFANSLFTEKKDSLKSAKRKIFLGRVKKSLLLTSLISASIVGATYFYSFVSSIPDDVLLKKNNYLQTSISSNQSYLDVLSDSLNVINDLISVKKNDLLSLVAKIEQNDSINVSSSATFKENVSFYNNKIDSLKFKSDSLEKNISYFVSSSKDIKDAQIDKGVNKTSSSSPKLIAGISNNSKNYEDDYQSKSVLSRCSNLLSDNKFIIYVDKDLNKTFLLQNIGGYKIVKRVYLHSDAVDPLRRTSFGQSRNPEGIYSVLGGMLSDGGLNSSLDEFHGIGYLYVGYPNSFEKKNNFSGKNVTICGSSSSFIEDAVLQGKDVMNVSVALTNESFLDLFRLVSDELDYTKVVIEDSSRPISGL